MNNSGANDNGGDNDNNSNNNNNKIIVPKEIRAWQYYDAAQSVYYIASGLLIPTFIVHLADAFISNKHNMYGIKSANAVWLTTLTTGTIVRIFCYLTFSSIADYGNIRFHLLRICTYIGAIATCCFFVVAVPQMLPMACFLAVLSNVASGLSVLFYDSYISPLSSCHNIPEHFISSKGTFYGYISMICFVIVYGCAFLLPNMSVYEISNASDSSNNDPGTPWLLYRSPLLLCGLWWLVGSHFTFPHLTPHQGLTIPDKARKSWLHTLEFGFVQGTRKQLKAIAALKGKTDVSLFLVAWCFLADSSSTALSSAAVFAGDPKNGLGVSPIYIGAAALLGFISAALGAYLFGLAVRKGYVKEKTVLIFNICNLCVLVTFVLWMQTAMELLLLAFLAGLHVGGIGAFTRSLLACMCPAGCEAETFSLFEISQKGTSWIGPSIIAALLNTYGDKNFRVILVSTILIECAIGLPIFILVNIERGKVVAVASSIRENSSDMKHISNSDSLSSDSLSSPKQQQPQLQQQQQQQQQSDEISQES